jgi:anti-sigma factor RsiW
MHPNEETLNEFADGSLGQTARSDVERHLESCGQCRTAVDDLREIRRAAGSLTPRQPPVRVWSRIERAIRLEHAHMDAGIQDLPPGVDERARGLQRNVLTLRNVSARLKGSRVARLGLAAAAVVALATAVTLRLAPSKPDTPGVPEAGIQNAGGTSTAQSVEAELRQASEHYEKAIKGLEQIASAEQGTLDPRTAATLQQNLAVIDQAINESRAALNTQPNSEPAQQSLIDNFKTKIGLLQDTVALINEMRKGNEAGAARIVSGLKQKS